jgi:arylsulfatase A-like enzyme
MNDIILVTADSLRADHCGWLGDCSLTPEMDDMVKDSLVYNSAIVPGPRTLSSVPVSHTGVHFPLNNHDTSKYEERIARIRNHINQFETISESLQEKGYTTIAYTANPWTSADNNFNTGFDEFQEVGREGGTIKEIFSGTSLEKPARFFDLWLHKDTWFSQWRTFYSELVESIEDADSPVFVWVFLLDTHNPYLVPRQDRHESSTIGMYSSVLRANSILNQSGGKTAYNRSISEETISLIKKAYRDSVRSVDKFIGKLREDIIDRNTVFIFHSDHGEAFGEHETFGHEPVLFEENIHVPLFIYNGGKTGTVEKPVSTGQIWKIINSGTSGQIKTPEKWCSKHVISRTEDSSSISVRGERWKYIIDGETEMLFNIQSDPGELKDVSEENKEVMDRFQSAKENYLEDLPEPSEDTGAVESDQMRDHLKSLGYLQE